MNNPQNVFWDSVANSKEFNDPFYLSQFNKYVNTNAKIIEYGCGYGRLLNLIYENGFKNISGFDFSSAMIARGQKQFPYLDLQSITHANIPLENESIDAAILSTVLCCVPFEHSQREIIHEICRILKPQGILYLTDFLITDSEHMQAKYQEGFAMFNDWGIYRTTEGAVVRHYSKDAIRKLLNNFSEEWYQEESFVTMNHNHVQTFHGIYKKY